MSAKHLSLGSQDPPRTEGLLRLYSMFYCPFAQRTRLVLKAKQIPYEIVNIHLGKKPEWYSKINHEGKVPALIDGDKVIIESLNISDYLNEKYPKNPLYSSDVTAKQKEKELIELIESVIKVFSQCCYTQEQKTPEQWMRDFVEVLQPFEDELAIRGTPYFGGNKSGMVDYMLWPWAERAPCIAFKLGQKPPIQDGQIPSLRKWRKNMLEDTAVKEICISLDEYWRFVQSIMKGEEAPYSELDEKL